MSPIPGLSLRRHSRRRRDRRRLGGPLPAQRCRRADVRPGPGGAAQGRRGAGQRSPGDHDKLVAGTLPAEGTLTFVATPEEAATGVDFVQESAPERMELKQDLLRRASAVAGPEVVFGSSTSGLLPTEMQQGMTHPERLVVGHPFNPVYLMPLVEICGGELTSDATKDRAVEVYTALGMHPLRLSKEIDGFVADRLMEALWREALWLINDGIATAEEIDDAIRFGPGLRWSFMGTLLIYRIAGGEAGMRHFMAQFGPALQWPWSKLTDVPELTDELLDTLVAQSDEQAAGATVRELEVLRDDCLIAVIQGLRGQDYGAGQVLDQYERTLFDRLGGASVDGRTQRTARCGCKTCRCRAIGWTTTAT